MPDTNVPDTNVPDTNVPDAGPADSSTPDTGTPDASAPETDTPDTGTSDAGTPDAGTGGDTGTPDTGTLPDAGTADAGTPSDAGTPDTGTSLDVGTPDAGTADTGTSDAGTADTKDLPLPDVPLPCGGTCVGLEDGNPCTKPECVAGTCALVAVAIEQVCADGDACTDKDTCVNGVCKGVSINCDDGNTCSATKCDAQSGSCVTQPVSTGTACGNSVTETKCSNSKKSVMHRTSTVACNGDATKPGCVTTWSEWTPKQLCKPAVCELVPGGAKCGATAQLPDLVFDVAQTAGTPKIKPGGAFTVTYRVKNGGAATASQATKLQVRTSRSATQLVGGSLVKTIDVPTLTAGAGFPSSGTQSFTVTLPNNAAYGQWTLWLIADGTTALTESDETNNVAKLAFIVDCALVAASCDDGKPCTKDACDQTTGACASTTVADGASCSDGDACTSGDTCGSSTCSGTPKACNDGNVCTADTCNPSTGACVATSLASGTACGAGTQTEVKCDDAVPTLVLQRDGKPGCDGKPAKPSCGTVWSSWTTKTVCPSGQKCQVSGGTAACSAAATLPDLMVDYAVVSPSKVSLGSVFTVKLRIKNLGAAAKATKVMLAMSRSKTVLTHGQQDAFFWTPDLAAGATYPVTGTISKSLVAYTSRGVGQLYLWVQIAEYNKESDTANNVVKIGYLVDCATKPDDCDDGNTCTTDTCDTQAGTCKHVATAAGASCTDGSTCSNATCANGSCVGTNAPNGTACTATAAACGAKATCQSGSCQASGGVSCNDGDACTLDACQSGVCQHRLVAACKCKTSVYLVPSSAFIIKTNFGQWGAKITSSNPGDKWYETSGNVYARLKVTSKAGSTQVTKADLVSPWIQLPAGLSDLRFRTNGTLAKPLSWTNNGSNFISDISLSFHMKLEGGAWLFMGKAKRKSFFSTDWTFNDYPLTAASGRKIQFRVRVEGTLYSSKSSTTVFYHEAMVDYVSLASMCKPATCASQLDCGDIQGTPALSCSGGTCKATGSACPSAGMCCVVPSDCTTSTTAYTSKTCMNYVCK